MLPDTQPVPANIGSRPIADSGSSQLQPVPKGPLQEVIALAVDRAHLRNVLRAATVHREAFLQLAVQASSLAEQLQTVLCNSISLECGTRVQALVAEYFLASASLAQLVERYGHCGAWAAFLSSRQLQVRLQACRAKLRSLHGILQALLGQLVDHEGRRVSIAESVRTQSAVSLANRFLCMPLPHKLSIGRASAGALGHPFQVTYGGSFRRAAAAAYLLPRKHHAVQFGELWVSSTQPGTASLERIDLASGAVQSMHPGAAVTALCADASSRVWLGHKDGRVSLWTAAGDPGPSISCGRSAISALQLDEDLDLAWVGTASGQLTRITVSEAIETEPKTLALLPVRGPIQQQKLLRTCCPHGCAVSCRHDRRGVTAICVFGRSAWTAGAYAAADSLVQWSSAGTELARAELETEGVILAIVALPLSRQSPGPSSTATAPQQGKQTSEGPQQQLASNMTSSLLGTGPREDWILLTGHARGSIKIWASAAGTAVPVASVAATGNGPCRSIVLCEAQGLWCAGYGNGRVAVRLLQHICLDTPLMRANQPLAAEMALAAPAAFIRGPKGRMHGLMGGDLAFVVVSRKARLTVWPAAAVYLAARNGCLCVPSAQQSQDLQLDWSSLDKSGQQAAAQDARLSSKRLGGMPSIPTAELLQHYLDPPQVPGSQQSPASLSTLAPELSGLAPLPPGPEPDSRQRASFGGAVTPDKAAAATAALVSSHPSTGWRPSADSTAMTGDDSSGDRALLQPALSTSRDSRIMTLTGSQSRPSREDNQAPGSGEASPVAPLPQRTAAHSGAARRQLLLALGSGPQPRRSMGLPRISLDRQQARLEGHSSWIIDPDALELKRCMGTGSLGSMWLGHWQATDVACKVLDRLEDYVETADIHTLMETEVAHASSLRHPCVNLFMGIVVSQPLILVLEYCARGSLADVLAKARANPALCRHLPWPRLINIALDAAKGMLQLHSHRPVMLHRDLKSSNLVIDRHWHTKVTDFYLSGIVAAGLKRTCLVDVRCSAPETFDGPHLMASDVYSFGMVLYELLTWEIPWGDAPPGQVIVAVMKGERPPMPDQGARELELVTGPLRQLINRCWEQEPAARPTFAALVVELRGLTSLLSARGPA